MRLDAMLALAAVPGLRRAHAGAGDKEGVEAGLPRLSDAGRSNTSCSPRPTSMPASVDAAE
jgi:hypothetical protein